MTWPWLDLPTRTDRHSTFAQLGVAFGAALLWMFAAPPYDLWPLAWIAMLPTIWLWAKAKSARRAAWLGGATGAFMTVLGFHWFAPMLHEHAHVPWPLGVLGLFALAAWQGLSLFFAGRAVWWIRAWSARRRGRPLPMALIAPIVVVALEHVWPVIFPYQLALTQSSMPIVIQFADLFGATAITALLIACAGSIWDLVERGRHAWRAPAAVAAITAAVLGYGTWRIDDIEARRAAAPHVVIGLLQPNEAMHLGVPDPAGDALRLDGLQRQSKALEDAGAKILVWSETSYPATLPRDLRRDLPPSSPGRIRAGFTAPVVIGAISEDRDARRRRYNSAFLLDGDRVVARDDKIHRVLGSEWNPLVEWFPSLEGTLPSSFSGGDHPVVLPITVDGVTVRMGMMICLEDTLPGHADDVADEGANLFVNMTIDTWFGTFAEPFQHRGLAVLRAVEQRADLVRAVNTGPSGLVEATGRLGPQTPVRSGEHVAVEGILVSPAIMRAGDTLYGTIGDVLPWTCVGLTVVGWFLGRRARRSEKKAENKATERKHERKAKKKR